MSGIGPLRTLGSACATLRRAKPRAGSVLRFTAARAWPCGPRPLRCSVLRAVAELAAFASLSTLEQLRRVSSRSALRALPASPALLGAAEALRPPPARLFAIQRHLFAKEADAQASSLCVGRTRACGARREAGSMPASRLPSTQRTGVCRKDGGGCPAARLCGAEERSPSVGARSALRELTRRGCSSVESEANVASSAARPKGEHRRGRGPQGHARAAVKRRRAPAPGFARLSLSTPKPNVRKGPRADRQAGCLNLSTPSGGRP